jgi:hypothetical protein
VAQLIAETFSSNRFTENFGSQTLSTGWAYNDALAAWYSLGNLALVVAVWQTYNSEPDRANQMIDLVRSELLRLWTMSDPVSARLQTVAAETEEQALRSFTSCKSGIELSLFFSRYVSRILGAPVPFTTESRFEQELLGIVYEGTDLLRNVNLSSTFIALTIAIKKCLENAAQPEKSIPERQADVTASSPSAIDSKSDLDVSDYGPASMAPSKEAELIQNLMSTDDKMAFDDLLSRQQKWLEEAAGTPRIGFHPEARACMWGLALAKIADAYREAGQTEKASFYMNAAWSVSNYPLFANNAALLSIALGDTARAENLLKSFLNEYHSTLTNQVFKAIIGGEMTLDELEQIAASARKRLLAIGGGINPMLV